jgi:hypothetical protein
VPEATAGSRFRCVLDALGEPRPIRSVDIAMQFLNNMTIGEIAGQSVTVVIRSNSDQVDTIIGDIFLKDGRLFIDCIPVFCRKHIVAVPDDAIISRAVKPGTRWKLGVFVHPQSEAGIFIKSLINRNLISRN